MVDGPGQGGTLRRQKIPNRYDYEVPVGRIIDYLETRADVDLGRIAVCGSSLGGYYAARAASLEHRLAAAISHGAVWSVNELWGEADDSHGLAGHINGENRQRDREQRRRGPQVIHSGHCHSHGWRGHA